jgi:hypothetical protein
MSADRDPDQDRDRSLMTLLARVTPAQAWRQPGDDVTVIDLKIFDHTGTALEMATRRAREEPDREPKGNEMLEKPQPVRNLVVG